MEHDRRHDMPRPAARSAHSSRAALPHGSKRRGDVVGRSLGQAGVDANGRV
jgi:hypothetical protein